MGGSVKRTLVLSLLLFATGCYHYRAWMPDVAAPATLPESRTLWTLAWGLVQPDVRPDNCAAKALAETTVSTNLGFSLLSVATLGFVAPATVEWRCAKPCPGGL